jgi:hypothetical protein
MRNIMARRPPAKRYRIPICVDRNERTMFRELAEKRGVSVGEMLRQLVLEERGRSVQTTQAA